MKEGLILESEDSQIGNWDFKEDSVPLPSQIPPQFDSQTLPESVRRSSAVEALIAQNDDLMSRLSVSLRRISELESHIEARAEENSQYKSRYENLRDQVLVLKEKTRILSERRGAEDADVDALKENIRLLEIRYAELFQASQNREAQLKFDLSLSTKNLSRLRKFRKNILAVAHNLQDNYKKTLKRLEQLTLRLNQNDAIIENLRRVNSESTTYIQNINSEHQRETESIIKSFESKLSALQTRNSELEERTKNFDSLTEERAQLNNQIVISERRFDDYRLQTQTEMVDLQKSLARHRAENKELTLQIESLKVDFTDTKNELAELKREKSSYEEQVETLQALWKDNQAQIEKLSEKNRAVQKLNQELSTAINQYRKEIREFKESADKNHIQSTGGSSETPLLINKIDQALGRMQVGEP